MDFDTTKIKTEYHDVIIIGSGIAGVYTALEISSGYDVAIITKEKLNISSSVLAQGGIAVSLDKKDSPELHFKDTIYAGAGLCDEKSVWVLVNEAAKNIKKLVKFGVNFDKKESSKELSFSREAAHSMNRIIHAGDTTGKEVCDKLISVVHTRDNIKIFERTSVVDLLTEDNVCKGLLAYDEDLDELKIYKTNIVICAAGGYGRLFANTTNPEVATGDGICMAYRAGAELMDLEFVQFHPTVLFHPQNKTFLISEAVRGEGGVLKNINGERFMDKYHELKDLAPRDVVSRAIFAEMKETGSDHVMLDVTFKGKTYLKNRFPNIYKTCLEYGLDISKDYIPVCPAEHYCMGGIRTDIFGRTNIKGLYACGETACNGIHGANRLASNSLLEGLVFGQKISDEVEDLLRNCSEKEKDFVIKYETNRIPLEIDIEKERKNIEYFMSEKVGIIRDREGLLIAKHEIDECSDKINNMRNKTARDCELQNMAVLSGLIVDSALEREESRGAHYRSDFPLTDDVNWKRSIIKSIEKR
jgi:L-aspartate oxidase